MQGVRGVAGLATKPIILREGSRRTRHDCGMRNHGWLWMVSALFMGSWSLGCGDGDDGGQCADPRQREAYLQCDDEVGGSCRSDRDCLDTCCDERHCGRGGMCTVSCRRDDDCPVDMLCEHDVCLFACDSDRDCAIGFRCEHGNRVCEAE